MSITQNKHFLGIFLIFATLIFVVSALIFSASLFNNSEIELLSSGCHEVGGEPELVLHNSLTHSYSFNCK
jgi:hypothetical protein